MKRQDHSHGIILACLGVALRAKDIADMSVTPNYKNYTLKELFIAKHNICNEKYPKRSAEIELAIFNKENGIIEEIEVVNNSKINKYSTFWSRFFALIIDGIVFAIILYMECFIFGVEYSLENDLLQTLNGFQFVIYTIFMHGFFGQTLGKMFMGIKVIDHDTEGEINIKQALRRESVSLAINIFSILTVLAIALLDVLLTMSTIPLYLDVVMIIARGLLYGIVIFAVLTVVWKISEFVTMLFNDKRRAVHDYIGKTVVVRI